MADTQHVEKTRQTTTHTVYEEPKVNLLSNILAILGFIIVITIVLWGLIHLGTISSSWFSSLFSRKSANAITVSAPLTSPSGVQITISWKYNPPTKGTYAFLYQCRSGFQFQTPGPAGTPNTVPCGAAFTVSGSDNALSLTPFLYGTSTLAVPLSVIFMPSASGTQAQGSATITITNGVITAAPAPVPVVETPAPAPAPTPAAAPQATPRPALPADLAVRGLSVSSDASGAAVATFDIVNLGGTASGSYSFTAQLPTVSGYTYTSPVQSSLSPGSHVVNTLRFTQAQSGAVSVNVIPGGADANSGNNYASQTLNAPYSNYNNQYAPGYGTQYLPIGQAGNTMTTYNAGYYPSSYQYQQNYPYSYQTSPPPPYSTYPGQGHYWYEIYPYNQAVQPYPYYYQNPNYYWQQQSYSTYYPYAY